MATRARGTRHRVALARPIIFGPRGAGSNATIPVPGTGTLLIDADTLVVSAQTVLRPRDRIAGAGALELVDVKDATPTADLYGMVVLNHPDSAPLGVTGVFWQATQPVSGPLTDAQLRAAAVPVSGAFFQATQPVSIAATLLVDVIDADARILGRTKIRDSGGTVIDPATKAQLPAALTGAGNLKVSLQEDGGAVIGVDDNGGSLTVDGVFWQATQPVSLAAAVDVSDRAARLLGVVYGSQAQQLKQTATNFNLQTELAVGGTLIDPRVLQAGTAQIGLVKISDGTDTALVSASGMVQTVENTNLARVNISIKFNSAAAPAADTLCSCVKNTDGVDAAGATTFAITSGKRFRVLGIKLSVRTTTAATPWGELTVRMNPSGAAVIGSPLVHRLTVGGTAAVIGNVAADYYFFPEGWELSGTMQLGLSFANNVATNVTDIVLFGYEYTP